MDASPQNAPPEKTLSRVPGAEPSARMDPWWWLVAIVIVTIIVLAVTSPDPYWRIIKFVGEIRPNEALSGIWITIIITIITFLLTLVMGLIGGLGRLAKNRFVRGISTLYVEVVRGIPLLVQLIFWYYAFPSVIQNIGTSLNISWMKFFTFDAFWMAVAGLTFCYGAYMSEIYRAGIQSIPKGQMEAARSLGMTYTQAMVTIILPQAVRVILPPVGNEFISLLKDSSLVSAVAVADLTRRGREFMGANYIPLETWTMIALLYLVLTLFSARMVSWIERKTRIER